MGYKIWIYIIATLTVVTGISIFLLYSEYSAKESEPVEEVVSENTVSDTIPRLSEIADVVEMEEDNRRDISLLLSSIQKDIKIKILDEEGNLIKGISWEAAITGGSGQQMGYRDDNKDGIIYAAGLSSGEYQVKLEGVSGYRMPASGANVRVKDQIEYRVIANIIDEIKTEDEIDEKKEDTSVVAELDKGPFLEDTVDFVPSRKILVKAASYQYEPYNGSVIFPDATMGLSPIRPKGNLMTAIVAGSVKLSKSAVALETGEDTFSLTYTVTNPTDETQSGIFWTSSNTDIAQVKDGLITTSEEEGQATITATVTFSNDTAASASCVVTVSDEENNTSSSSTTSDIDTIYDGTNGTAGSTTKGTSQPSGTVSSPKVEENTALVLKDTKGDPLFRKKGNTYVMATLADWQADQRTYYSRIEATAEEYIYNGWQTRDGKTFYYTKNGSYVTGEQVINGISYIFLKDGSLTRDSGAFGIDVSKWNKEIDWTKVKEAGVRYAIIRIGYRGSSTGSLVVDPYFERNIEGAKKAGIPVGVYFFTQALTEAEAVEEASMVAALLENTAVEYPIFLDVEGSGGRADTLATPQRTDNILAFLETIENQGYSAGVYANKNWFSGKIETDRLEAYHIWLAQYNRSEPDYEGRYDMWQYSSKGNIDGISGYVDMNINYINSTNSTNSKDSKE